MPRTLSGLQTGEFDEIDVLHSIKINTHPGVAGQVLTSDGTNTNWSDVPPELPETTTADDKKIFTVNQNGEKVFVEPAELIDGGANDNLKIDDITKKIKLNTDLVVNTITTSGNLDVNGSFIRTTGDLSVDGDFDVNSNTVLYSNGNVIVGGDLTCNSLTGTIHGSNITDNTITASKLSIPADRKLTIQLDGVQQGQQYNPEGSADQTINIQTTTPNLAQLILQIGNTQTTYNPNTSSNLNVSIQQMLSADYYRDTSSQSVYRILKPSDFVMDDDNADNRWVISDHANTEASAVNRGTNATQVYVYFDIPSGYKFTGYRINLTDQNGAQHNQTTTGTFYTRAGVKSTKSAGNYTPSLSWLFASGVNGYNTEVSLSSSNQPTNNWSSSWTASNINDLQYGVVMAYRLYWSSSIFFPGGYVKFDPV